MSAQCSSPVRDSHQAFTPHYHCPYRSDAAMRRTRIAILTLGVLCIASKPNAQPIDGKYASLGGASGFLGSPAQPEQATPNGAGRYRHFEGGSIYWSPQSGAHEVHGLIRDKWAALGWENSFLGFPTTDETPTPNGAGRYNHFQGGSIYWSPQTGAHEVHGRIRDKWEAFGRETSFLGFPTTDESPTPDGVGRYNHFQGGSIYWTPNTGAHEVHGYIRGRWQEMGWESSSLGYPVSDEQTLHGGPGRVSHFQHGRIEWTPSGGAVVIANAPGPQPPVPAHESPTETHIVSSTFLARLRENMTPGAALNVVRANGTIKSSVAASATSASIVQGEAVATKVIARSLQIEGRTRYLLPVQALVVNASGQTVALQPFLEPLTPGLEPTEDGKGYSVDVLVGLQDPDNPSASHPIDVVSAVLRSRTAHVQVKPSQPAFSHTGSPYETAVVSGDPADDRVAVEMAIFGRKVSQILRVFRPKLVFEGDQRTEGFGVGRIKIQLQLAPGAGATPKTVTVTSARGSVHPASVTISPHQPAEVEYRARLAGPDVITAMIDGAPVGRHRVDAALPWRFLLLSLVGGGLGAVIMRLLRPVRLVAVLSRYFAGGVLMGILVAVLFVLGVNVTPVPVAIQDSPIAVLAISAVGAIAAIPLVSKWSDGFKGFLEGDTQPDEAKAPST